MKDVAEYALLSLAHRALSLFLVGVFTVGFLTGCVYQPINVAVHVPTTVVVQDSDVGLSIQANEGSTL